MKIISINSYDANNITYSKRKNKNGLNSISVQKLNKTDTIKRVSFGHLFATNKNIEVNFLPTALKKIKNQIYRIHIFDKIENKPVEALLQYKYLQDEETPLNIYSKNDASIIGTAKIDFKRWFIKGFDEPCVYLTALQNHNPDKYKGIGSTLIQAAIELSLKPGSKGDVFLLANNKFNKKNDPFIFYYRQGFTTIHPLQEELSIKKYLKRTQEILNINSESLIEKLEKTIGKPFNEMDSDEQIISIYKTISKEKNIDIDKIFFNFRDYMFLDKHNFQKIWTSKIEKHPILCNENKLIQSDIFSLAYWKEKMDSLFQRTH